MKKLLTTTVAAGATAAAAVLALAAPSGATPVETGCPTGYDALPVSYFAELSPFYGLPARLDAAGNGDGVVCALALPEGFTHSVEARGGQVLVPILFRFAENDSEARR